jgi:hypothetical protein
MNGLDFLKNMTAHTTGAHCRSRDGLEAGEGWSLTGKHTDLGYFLFEIVGLPCFKCYSTGSKFKNIAD